MIGVLAQERACGTKYEREGVLIAVLHAEVPWTILYHDNNELTGILKARRNIFVILGLCIGIV